MLPTLSPTHKLLLSTPHSLLLSSSGNGSVLRSLPHPLTPPSLHGLHVFGVDNLLTTPCDPAFVRLSSSADVVNKCVLRSRPSEKIGVMALLPSGSATVVEYSDLPPSSAGAAKAEGDGLMYDLGNICSHLFTAPFLARARGLPTRYHVARKTVKHWCPASAAVVTTEGCVKLESFIFDCFEYADRVAVRVVDREGEFSPIKNREGTDSRDTAVGHLRDRFLREMGVGGEGGEGEGEAVEGGEGGHRVGDGMGVKKRFPHRQKLASSQLLASQNDDVGPLCLLRPRLLLRWLLFLFRRPVLDCARLLPVKVQEVVGRRTLDDGARACVRRGLGLERNNLFPSTIQSSSPSC